MQNACLLPATLGSNRGVVARNTDKVFRKAGQPGLQEEKYAELYLTNAREA
jgi:hypothetical protein